MEITLDDLKRMSPDAGKELITDEYYLTLARYIDKLWGSMRVFPELDGRLRKQTVMALTGYYQDVVSDAGIWRSFVRMCRSLYGRPVPLYDAPDDYVDSELNPIDVQFVVWYALESGLGFHGLVSPFDSDLLRFAGQVYKLFDFLYDDAPFAEGFKVLQELELDDSEQLRDISLASGWLFWNSYLLRPVSKYAYEPDVSEDEELSAEETLSDEGRLRITFGQPTGPLALFVKEWLGLAVDGRMPRTVGKREADACKEECLVFEEAVGNSIAFFRTYGELEQFLAEKLGWTGVQEEHLSHMKNSKDFVLYADRDKGLVAVPGIARYVKHPYNPLYDAAVAAGGAHRLVLEPSVCPVGVLKYLFENGLVPDAVYPACSGSPLLQDNWDFFARMYLCSFYRAD